VVALNKVSVIFAVIPSRKELYERLSARIEGSAVGALVNDTTSLVKIVKDNYYVSLYLLFPQLISVKHLGNISI